MSDVCLQPVLPQLRSSSLRAFSHSVEGVGVVCLAMADYPNLVLCPNITVCMQANSQRYGTAASLLPTIHWVLLTALSCLVLVAFVLFDSDFEVSAAENRKIFAVVAAMLCTILLVCYLLLGIQSHL